MRGCRVFYEFILFFMSQMRFVTKDLVQGQRLEMNKFELNFFLCKKARKYLTDF